MQHNSNAYRRVSAKAVGSFLPKVTGRAFEKFGFPASAVLTDWAAIVGPEMAAFTRPERLKWPKRQRDEAVEEGVGPHQPGATLVLRVDGPVAIELQHRSDQLLERINRYFGYQAVSDIRMLQAPLDQVAAFDFSGKPKDKPQQVLLRKSKEAVAGIQNVALREALAGLARRVDGAHFDTK